MLGVRFGSGAEVSVRSHWSWGYRGRRRERMRRYDGAAWPAFVHAPGKAEAERNGDSSRAATSASGTYPSSADSGSRC